MKMITVLTMLLSGLQVRADSCFDASAVIEQAASPFASAPQLEQALIKAANQLGWQAEKDAANGAAYMIIGKYGTVGDDVLQVCVVLNHQQQLAYQVFSSEQGREAAGFMPLAGQQQ